ncbi:MAC/perforin domain-containing protein [Rhodococcus sp. MS16]|uniref:MAC/perforin domain-containing protein n=1 Tax=Rhodococcus sp. MS16 TaxID=2579941 RepID=UPI0015621532
MSTVSPLPSATTSTSLNLVPGAAILGYGLNIAHAKSTSEVTQRIVNIHEETGTTVTESGVEYLLPANVDLIDIHKSSSTAHIFETTSEYSAYMAASTEIKASAWGFSGEFDASYSSLANASSARYYGLMEATTNLWDLSVKNLEELPLDSSFKADLIALGDAFTEENQFHFYNFFNKWGTHVISTVSVGGFLNYCVTVSSSSSFNKESAKANLKCEYNAVFAEASVAAHAEWEKMDKSWISSRDAQLAVQGGEPGILASAVPPTTPTEVNFNKLIVDWTSSVGTRPGVTSQILQPISHVAPTPQVPALDDALEAYLNRSVTVIADQEIVVEQPAIRPVSNTSSITIGQDAVSAPNEKTTAFAAEYWIVMADEKGVIQYNDNRLGDDPDLFEELIFDKSVGAQAKSHNKTWWTVVVAIGTTHPPSAKAMNWLSQCGIPREGWYDGYAGWPNQVIAFGKSNVASFKGQLRSVDSPFSSMRTPEQRITLRAPLFLDRS